MIRRLVRSDLPWLIPVVFVLNWHTHSLRMAFISLAALATIALVVIPLQLLAEGLERRRVARALHYVCTSPGQERSSLDAETTETAENTSVR